MDGLVQFSVMLRYALKEKAAIQLSAREPAISPGKSLQYLPGMLLYCYRVDHRTVMTGFAKSFL